MGYIDIISEKTGFLVSKKPFVLESGVTLPEVTVAYRTWGALNRERSNVIMICHALTGSADADRWWEGLFGKGKAFDETKDFIICSNVLGSCYGTTGPLAVNPLTGKRYGPDFPSITIRDMVHLQRLLLDELGIEQVKLVVGASLGGMQVLEWGCMFPEKVRALMPMGISGRHSAWCIAQSEAQRQAIAADSNWKDGWYEPEVLPAKGLAAARMMAMCSYRSFENFRERFGREKKDGATFQAESYLRHQGEKLVERFDANTYVALTKAMDTHDLARGRGSYERVLASLAVPVEVLSITSDILYPKEEQEELARYIRDCTIRYLSEPFGHDAFLIVVDKVSDMVREFLGMIEAKDSSAA
ncbi:homoserine O-acetyltransferase [Prosthecochloris sp. GSB1]|uniref:homoserine O-acetyltransferase MetX n=1 Tax=Prosthecochloris sp. GSB1 TaxID=281093 RepID=UPI000B8D0B22|nr:homoserine O-acetyltransferase [Prosthecochloris sp. GSB1]ASQ90066.1 homoserine O-acetyltransferase [Prosthecochloris sp. GSB1]